MRIVVTDRFAPERRERLAAAGFSRVEHQRFERRVAVSLAIQLVRLVNDGTPLDPVAVPSKCRHERPRVPGA